MTEPEFLTVEDILAAALVFLELNGAPIETGTEALYTLTMAVARGEGDKDGIASSLRALA